MNSRQCTLIVINEVETDKEDLMQDFVSLVTSFVARFIRNYRQDRRDSFKNKNLTKEIYNLPSTWLSARMKRCAVREALSMCQSNDQYRNESNLEMEVEQLLGDDTAFEERHLSATWASNF